MRERLTVKLKQVGDPLLQQATKGQAMVLRLLADKMVRVKLENKISHETVRTVLKTTYVRKVKGWVIPPEANAEFVATHGDPVLDVYKGLMTRRIQLSVWMNLQNNLSQKPIEVLK